MLLSISSAALMALAASTSVHALPASNSASPPDSVTFRDDFSTFNKDVWRCEYDCPVIEGGKARYRLRSGVAPNNHGSWSKSRYTPARFTAGTFTVSFSLTERPAETVWWGIALWGDELGDDSFNEINFGYSTSQSYADSELRFESARRGKAESLRVDTGVNLYDGEYHNATLEYDATRVALYFDGVLLKEITDTQFIPTDPMDFILGPRLVTGSEPLSAGFTESIDWVEISA